MDLEEHSHSHKLNGSTNSPIPAICFIFAGSWEFLRSSYTISRYSNISRIFKVQTPIEDGRRQALP